MPRYFIEVAYNGSGLAGFQIQENAITVQEEMEKALFTYFKKRLQLTGSSRTDAGVHALQNFFHFDVEDQLSTSSKDVYHLNAILPRQIVIKRIVPVKDEAHCRFDALYRKYEYRIYREKNPFLEQTAFFYPYTVDLQLLNMFADQLQQHHDFTSFSKKNTQVKSFNCKIYESVWQDYQTFFTYTVTADRFLRGMVKGLVGTMLRGCRAKITQQAFAEIIESRDSGRADFSVPSHGLFLLEVAFPDEIFSTR